MPTTARDTFPPMHAGASAAVKRDSMGANGLLPVTAGSPIAKLLASVADDEEMPGPGIPAEEAEDVRALTVLLQHMQDADPATTALFELLYLDRVAGVRIHPPLPPAPFRHRVSTTSLTQDSLCTLPVGCPLSSPPLSPPGGGGSWLSLPLTHAAHAGYVRVSVYANTLFAACISSRPCTVCPSLASTRQPHCGPLYTLFPFLTVFHLVTPSSLFLLLSPLPHCPPSCHPFLTVPPLVTPSSLSLLLSPLPHCPSSCHPFFTVPPLVTLSSLSLP